MFINELKDISKYILKKSYRDNVNRIIKDNSIVKVNDVNGEKQNEVMILRRLNSQVGTFSDYIVFLKAIEFALEQNKIPVIDRKTVKNVFTPGEDNVNTWEMFFQQPCNIGLGDIDYKLMSVEICNSGSGLYPVSLLSCKDKQIVEYWRMIAQRYIRLNSDLELRVQNNFKRIMAGKRVLGLSIREGYQKLAEMKAGVIWGHPIQESPKNLLSLARKKMTEWDLEYVFITCQTTDSVELFANEFGDKALFLERNRTDYENLIEGSRLREKTFVSARENEIDYVVEMNLLSKCNSLICSRNSGSEAAFIMSKGYDNLICIDKGVYN